MIGLGPAGHPIIVPTGDKAALFWENFEDVQLPQMFCQVIDSAGKIYFPEGGESLGVGLFPEIEPQLSILTVTSDSMNAFLVFLSSNTKRHIKMLEPGYARGQKIKDTLLLWEPEGVRIAYFDYYPHGFTLAPDFNGGLFICWGKDNGYRGPDLYMQSIRSDASLRFAQQGLKVWENYSIDSDDDIWMKTVNDGFGGIVVTWDTWSDSTEGDIIANRVDTLGNTLWGNGVRVCEAPQDQIHPEICRIDSNFIIVWQDERNGNWDIYAQSLDLNGNVGIGEKKRLESSSPIALQIYPNPSCQFIDIKFQLLIPGYVTLKIYNVIGQEVRTLVSSSKKAGYYFLHWDRRNNYGKIIPSGIYLCELKVRGDGRSLRIVKKIVLTRQRRDYE